MMMRILILVLTFASLIVSCNGQKTNKEESETPITTYYFIRHAEKDLSDPANRNPDLTPEGEARAQRWATYFEDKGINAVYSTNYTRTMRTAQPTASLFNLEIKNYDPSNLNSAAFQEATKGKKVVVVGHSNTTSQFANKVSKTNLAAPIDESEYYHLKVVRIYKEQSELEEVRVD